VNPKLLSFAGKTQNVSEWAREIGISQSSLTHRLNRAGWPLEKALSLKRPEIRGRQPTSMMYRKWLKIRSRCLRPADPAYKYYGGRGITICQRWGSFKNFFADMGLPLPGMSIERINNNGPYAPENCKWATRLEQMANTRIAKHITHAGKTMCIGAWSREIGIHHTTVSYRLRVGIPIDAPKKPRKPRARKE